MNKKCGLLLDMGLGKTLVATNIVRYLIQNQEANKALVVCPTSIIYNWEDAINESSEYDVQVISDSLREDRLYKFKNSTARFNIINYESLYPTLRDLNILKKRKKKTKTNKVISEMAYNKNYVKMIKELGYDTLIFDESSRYMKNPYSDRSRSCIALSDSAYNKFLLTGTFISNKPTDLFTQFRVMREGKVFGFNYHQFLNTFFTRESPYHPWEVQKNKIRTLNSYIRKYCIRKTQEECLPDLPKAIIDKLFISYNESDRAIYNKIKANVIEEIETELGKAHINVKNIFTQLLKLQQVTSGFIKDDKSGLYKRLRHTPKLDTLIDHIKTVLSNDNSIIVWCRFLYSIDMIETALEGLHIPCITMSGRDNSAKKKYKKWKTFQTTNCPVFIGQVESGGFGIELYKEDYISDKQYMVFYENVWDASVKQQAEARIVRSGQKSIPVLSDLIIRDTIDERILYSIKHNKSIADMIVEGGTSII